MLKWAKSGITPKTVYLLKLASVSFDGIMKASSGVGDCGAYLDKVILSALCTFSKVHFHFLILILHTLVCAVNPAQPFNPRF